MTLKRKNVYKPMETKATLLLRPGEADRVIAGHPWIYKGNVLRLTKPVADGDLIQVKDHRYRFLGVGFYNSKSKIQVRMLSPDRIDIDRKFFKERIGAALAWRRKYLPQATSFRVVNAESDFLSGLVIDKYEDVLVLQTSSLGMDRHKHLVLDALNELFAPRAVVERNEIAPRKFEGLDPVNGLLAGQLGSVKAPEDSTEAVKHPAPLESGPDTRHRIRINGLQFDIDLMSGQKTGFYLDQQANYQRVAELIAKLPGARVLDGFSFLGGFALHAARAGATQVHGVDQSADAVTAAQQQAELNGLSDRCQFESANVFDWLKARSAGHGSHPDATGYDLIILDPPSFTRNRASVPDALRGYKEIHLRALKLLNPGGILATFCCSHHVDAGTFLDAILAAAYDDRRILRQVDHYTQGADHPIVPSIPETEYLKGYAFEVAR